LREREIVENREGEGGKLLIQACPTKERSI